MVCCESLQCQLLRTMLAVLIVLTMAINIGRSIKTIPPDEIIAILDQGAYNKHHLPTHFAANASTKIRRTIRGSNGWMLIMEQFQNVSEDRIRFIQRDPSSGRMLHLTMNRPVALDLYERLATFVTSRFNEMGVNSDEHSNGTRVPAPSSLSSSGRFDSLESSIAKLETLQGGRIGAGADQLRLYFINFVHKKGEIALLITESKGAIKRSTISIPFGQWHSVSDILEEFLSRKFTAPPGAPTLVSISMYIEGMSSFRAQSMDFHVDIYLSERWQDPRLGHSGPVPVLLRDWSIFEKLWHPDLYFANAKEAKYHSVTAQNFGMYIWPNGSIYLDVRVSLVVNCMMDLSYFPLDSQECFIRILSYAHDADHLSLTWEPIDNISQNADILLPDMDLVALTADYCNGSYIIGEWSCARARFRMRREIMHHILQSYIPTALIVVISWFSFWLDADSVPGRVSLCITTLLTLATQAQAAKMSLPQVSYCKAIDVWLGTCMAFVFGVMIEFTIVNYLSRRVAEQHERDTKRALAKKRQSSCLLSAGFIGMAASPQTMSTCNNSQCNSVTPRDCDVRLTSLNHDQMDAFNCNNLDEHTRRPPVFPESAPLAQLPEKHKRLGPEEHDQKQINRRLATRVDGISRYIFPFSFLLFNAIYWPFYLRGRDYVNTSL